LKKINIKNYSSISFLYSHKITSQLQNQEVLFVIGDNKLKLLKESLLKDYSIKKLKFDYGFLFEDHLDFYFREFDYRFMFYKKNFLFEESELQYKMKNRKELFFFYNIN